MLNLRMRNLLWKFMIGKQILIIATATDLDYNLKEKLNSAFFGLSIYQTLENAALKLEENLSIDPVFTISNWFFNQILNVNQTVFSRLNLLENDRFAQNDKNSSTRES